MNWAPDQLRTRGQAAAVVRTRRILVIGAGSLGGAVANNLLRMGATSLAVLDHDLVEVGNLSRHVLGMDAVGRGKASALAAHLNQAMPNAEILAFTCSFPPTDEAIAEKIRSYDVIVDCSASDDVLDAMASFHWKGEKLFFSLAMTWRAEGLLTYAASKISFPAIDAKVRFAATPTPDVDSHDARIEGIGCWHPVFPATADDVQLWAAVGTEFIRRTMEAPVRSCYYFRQVADGTVERVDA